MDEREILPFIPLKNRFLAHEREKLLLIGQISFVSGKTGRLNGRNSRLVLPKGCFHVNKQEKFHFVRSRITAGRFLKWSGFFGKSSGF
ncbi:hypothetical protein PSAB_02335 [Paenibacillus sabinae T27]|uniref:Uncharacterized protein n=1 Tax=Paenibacillus sabinae T27 TaxID=1268072 RepID=X4ZSL2_9BACL|nr:hypothetical protein PSAB_02335 [Paenibacillus sabinae T27]